MNVTATDLVRSLVSTVCPACGDQKRIRNSICRACWDQLPRKAQARLYDQLGEGYEEAIENAFKLLERQRFQLPEPEPPAAPLFTTTKE